MTTSPDITPLPPRHLLAQHAPGHAWAAAYAQAALGRMQRFNMGAVILDPISGRIISRGYSQYHKDLHLVRRKEHSGLNNHAEAVAIQRGKHANLKGSVLLIVCVGAAGNHAWSARPCLSCLRAMDESGIATALFAEKAHGRWTVQSEDVASRVSDFAHVETDTAFARLMRLPAADGADIPKTSTPSLTHRIK